jgi:hypothetical protein
MVRLSQNRAASAVRHGSRLAIAAVLLFLVSNARAAAPTCPEFEKVSRAILDYFQAQPDHERRDLVSQRQVRAAIAQVATIGWNIPEQDKIAGRALADDSFIIREFSTPEGKKFMRKLAQHPGTYSRLDRLSTLGNGQATIRDLINQKQGEDLITYLATTSGGKNLGKMMAGTKGGVDLNKPTGRIYTVDDLIDGLKQAYDASP